MRPLDLAGRTDRLLCIGAHADDIEIGCGGTVLQLLAANPCLHVDWVVLSGAPPRDDEARAAAADILRAAASSDVRVEAFPDRRFPEARGELKRYFDELGGRVAPDLVLAPRPGDRHQDHALVGDLVWQTFRNHLVLHYEIPKYEADLAHPTCYVPLDELAWQGKLDVLARHFPTQHDRYWWCPPTFEALLRLRGLECRAPSGLAEAFEGPKVVLGAARAACEPGGFSPGRAVPAPAR